MYRVLPLGICLLLACSSSVRSTQPIGVIDFITNPPQLDGSDNDPCWAHASIQAIDQLWKGKYPFASDYLGRFRVCADSSHVFLLIEILDDSLATPSLKPTEFCEDRDALDLYYYEPLVQQNGEDSLFYQIKICSNGQIQSKTGILQPGLNHVQVAVKQENKLTRWELSFPRSAQAGRLSPTKFPDITIGLAVSYTDWDKGSSRDCIMVSVPQRIHPDRGEIEPRTLTLFPFKMTNFTNP